MMHTCILLLALFWIGCRSNGYNKSDAAGRSFRDAAAEVDTESRSIEATLAALNDLVNQPAADLKPQFHRYSSALNRLVASAAQTERTRQQMELKSAEYFGAWDKEVAGINYGIIRELSEARKTEVTNRFHSINSRYLEAQSVVRPLITYLEDIRTALSVDLTSAGLNAVKSIVNNADLNSRKVQTALANLSEDLTASGAGLLSVVPRDATVERISNVNGEPPTPTAEDRSLTRATSP